MSASSPRVSVKTRLRYTIDKRLRPTETRLEKPVFIIGCGRSGTTILGRLLQRHPDVTYLNEPRNLWSVDPRTDIWSVQAGDRLGRLMLTAGDVKPETAARLREAFALARYAGRKGMLIEKLPINSFRVGYIEAVFPDARFIHLLRNGLEVARSIARETENPGYRWYGHNDYKWRLLADYASECGFGHLVALAENDMTLRGLLEWRLSVESALESLASVPHNRQLTLRYQQLLDDPLSTCAVLEDDLGLAESPRMREFAQEQIQRKTTALQPAHYTPEQDAIGGELMHRSVEEAW